MRKLASIQTIKTVESIPNADNIEKITILGWQTVAIKGEFKPGDRCIFYEIDSLLPEHPVYEFLRKSSWVEKLNKFRLKTVRLRKTLSQGLVISEKTFPSIMHKAYDVGTDLTDILDIEKYDPPIPAELRGNARKFSWPISKTSEIRIQSNPDIIKEITGKPYYISVKIDGTSSSQILNNELEFHACGRRYSYKKSKSNTYWRIANRYDIKEKLIKHYESTGIKVSLQGEVAGPGIRKNKIGISDIDLYVFNVIDTVNLIRLPLNESLDIVKNFGMKFVPILETGDSFNYTLEELLEKADGKYKSYFQNAKKGQRQEGIVIRSLDGTISFKVVNNKYLLNNED